MKLVDVYWTPRVNRLVVTCDCGNAIDHPSNYSMVVCNVCRRAELWHSIDPVPPAGQQWSERVMENVVR
jgi:hypothetical protein